jgi:hypothetical protein
MSRRSPGLGTVAGKALASVSAEQQQLQRIVTRSEALGKQVWMEVMASPGMARRHH